MAISTQTERSVCAAALTAHHPSEGTIVCPCPVGPELRLKAVLRTHPLSTQSPREPGQCWAAVAISTYASTGSQCTGERTSSVPSKGDPQSEKQGPVKGEEVPVSEQSLEIGAQPGGPHPERGMALTKACPGNPEGVLSLISLSKGNHSLLLPSPAASQ